MAAVGNTSSDSGYLDDDPLVGRLRGLEWTEVPTDVRERCWERISTRIVSPDSVEAERVPTTVRARDCGERYAFTRRLIPTRVSVAQGWSRRPSYRPALTVS